MKITSNQETLIISLVIVLLISGVFYTLVQAEKMKHDNTVCRFLFEEHELVAEISQIYINYGMNATEFWCNHYCPKSVEEGIEDAKNNVLEKLEVVYV